jgi:hypothetical protein
VISGLVKYRAMDWFSTHGGDASWIGLLITVISLLLKKI